MDVESLNTTLSDIESELLRRKVDKMDKLPQDEVDDVDDDDDD